MAAPRISERRVRRWFSSRATALFRWQEAVARRELDVEETRIASASRLVQVIFKQSQIAQVSFEEDVERIADDRDDPNHAVYYDVEDHPKENGERQPEQRAEHYLIESQEESHVVADGRHETDDRFDADLKRQSRAKKRNRVEVPCNRADVIVELLRLCVVAWPMQRWEVASLKGRLTRGCTVQRPPQLIAMAPVFGVERFRRIDAIQRRAWASPCVDRKDKGHQLACGPARHAL